MPAAHVEFYMQTITHNIHNIVRYKRYARVDKIDNITKLLFGNIIDF